MGKQNKTKRYIWGGQQSRDKQKQLRLALALACCGGALLWATPIQAQKLTKVGVDLTDGQTYVVKQGETISASADNRQALVEKNNSATAIGVQLDSGSATIQGSQIPITVQAWGGTAYADEANVDKNGQVRADAIANAHGMAIGVDSTTTGAAVITAAAEGGMATTTAMGASTNAVAYAYVEACGLNANTNVNGDAVITLQARGGKARSEANYADTATDTGTATKATATAYGLLTSDISRITINGDAVIKLQAWGGEATSKANYATAAGDARVEASANANAYGLFSYRMSTITVNGSAVITSQAWGGEARIEADYATYSEFVATAHADGLYTEMSTITVDGDAVITSQATGGTAKSTGAAVSANASAEAYGFHIYGGTINIGGDAVIMSQATGGTATSESGSTDAYAKANGLYADGGSITVGGDAVITAQATGGTANGKQDKDWARSLYAIDGTITLNAAGTRTVQLIGDVEAKSDGQVSVPLTNADSFLQGNVLTDSTGAVDLTVVNGAVWQPVYDNRNGSFFGREPDYQNVDSNGYQTTVNDIDKITLQNGGVVDLGWDTPLRVGSWRTMKINELTTNAGVIRINSDIIGGTGDVFEITNVNADASLGVQIGYDPVIEKVYGTYTGEHTVLTGTDAQSIATYGVTGENRARAYTPTMDGVKMVAVKIKPSSNIKAAGSAAYGGLQLGAAAGNHLNKWLGELRDGYEDGVWARVYGGDLKNNANGHMKTRYKGIQGGYDQAYDENGGTGRIGGAFSYASGDLELPRGGGDNKAWDFALYKTWQGAKGHYYDLVLHYGKVDTDYHTTDLSRHYSTASFDAHTLGMTAEYGYRKDLQAGWYCQPQAEVSWFRLGSADYTASSGMQVAQDSATSLQGRLGIGVGRKLANGTHYYATLSGVHEFDGKVSLRGDGMGYEQDYGGTWGEFVLGVTAPIDKSWDGYASVERLFGGDVGSTWQLNAGVRLRF